MNARIVRGISTSQNSTELPVVTVVLTVVVCGRKTKSTWSIEQVRFLLNSRSKMIAAIKVAKRIAPRAMAAKIQQQHCVSWQ